VTRDSGRRRRIEDICDAALERDERERAAFVAESCGDDDKMRQEVEALLSHAVNSEQFLAAPIGAVAASVLSGAHGGSLVGRQIGSYKVLSLLGAGGMGDVYRAHDTKLGRDVAIKVVADDYRSDPDRLARFEREARVLATLNHPHIGAIYGLEEADGICGLVLELVEGETIIERLAAGPMPSQEALVTARQIADALEAAHEKGIVHRDLKPANIKITPDGTVKVLDFGLAKVFARAGAGLDASHMATIASEKTQEGVIAGTVAYMSPEQARSKEIDKRTDVWAFGCVLFEMLTARPAFRGETSSDTIAAILERDPDWNALPARSPASIRRLIQRCLEKDPKRRVRDIGDARIDIEEALGAGTSPGAAVAAATPTGFRGWGWRPALLSGTAILLGLTSALLLIDRFARTPATLENPLEGATFTRLTDFEGTELDAAISPDGRSVAYVSDRDGQLDVVLTQVGSGVYRNITQGKDPELPAPVRATGFSADGSQVWLGGGSGRRLQSVPLMGGAPRPFLSDMVVNIAWSRDGARLAYHTRHPGDPIYVADRDGTDARQIYVNSNPGGHNHFPIWSPDGRWIYFVSGYPATEEMDLWRIGSSGGSPERLTQHNNEVGYPTFIDERHIVYIARDDRGTGPWLWTFDVERMLTRRVSIGPATYTSVSATADGSRLIATVADLSTSLWSVPILDRPAGETEAVRFKVPTVNAAAPRFADTSLFYRSAGSSGNGLWRHHNGESGEIYRGPDAVTLEPPAISPDQSRVAIALRRSGKLRMEVLSTDGAERAPLSDAIDVAGAASWSPDGTSILTGGSDAKGTGLFKIPIDGGAPVRLVTGQALDPIWSPKEDLIVYTGANDVGSQALLRAIRSDGTRVDLPEIQVRRDGGGSRARFLPDGTGLVYMQGFALAQDFWLLDLTTKRRRPLTKLNDQAAMWSFDISPDGKQIIFDRSRDNSHVVIIDLARREQR
jgi:Tol biopolymer transport system component